MHTHTTLYVIYMYKYLYDIHIKYKIIYTYIKGDLLQGKSYGLPSVSWRPKKAGGIILI